MYKYLLVAAIGLHAHAGAAESWPTQPVQIVVPFSPGGPTDSLARYLADRLQQEFKTTVIVENKPGAGGLIGARYVARAKPDGHTFVIGSADLFAKTNPLLVAEYDPLKDLDVVAKLTDSYVVLAANKDLNIGSVAELKTRAARPDSIRCGSGGIATVGHYLCADLAQNLGVQFLHIPFKGMNEATTALMGGVIDVLMSPSLVAQAKAGGVQPLMAGRDHRMQDLPQVPTSEESSVDFHVPTWFGMAAPAGVDAAVMERMSGALERIMQDDRTTAVILPFGQYAAFADTKAFREENLQAKADLEQVEKFADVR